MIETADLLTFLAVVRSGSISGAAERLHLTQPAVSKRLAALEEKLDAPLFERGTRPLRLTEPGECLLPRAQRMLKELEDTETAVQNLRGSSEGSLKLACSHHIGLHYLPQVIRHYQQQFPAVELILHFVGSEEAPELLQSGVADLALVTLPARIAPPLEVVFQRLDPLLFVVSRDHELATQQMAELSRLAELPALLPEETTETFRAVQSLFDQNGLALQPAIPTNYLETLRMMVSVGLGWSVLPRSMLDEGLFVIEPPGAPALTRQLGAMIDGQRTRSHRLQGFLNSLESAWQRANR